MNSTLYNLFEYWKESPDSTENTIESFDELRFFEGLKPWTNSYKARLAKSLEKLINTK